MVRFSPFHNHSFTVLFSFFAIYNVHNVLGQVLKNHFSQLAVPEMTLPTVM